MSWDATIAQEISETILPRCLTFSNDRGEAFQINVQNGTAMRDNLDGAIEKLTKGAEWIAVKSSPTNAGQGRIVSFLQSLATVECDAVHFKGTTLVSTYGAADDLAPLATRLATQGKADRSFACSASHDLTHILFCGVTQDEILIFRTRQIPLRDILARWKSA